MNAICRTLRWAFALVPAFAILGGCGKHEPAGEPAEESAFREGVRIEAAGEPIDVEVGHLVPRVCDWNNDGKKDLVVGQFARGEIRLYLNEGTDAVPVFEDSTMLHAGGKPIRLDAG